MSQEIPISRIDPEAAHEEALTVQSELEDVLAGGRYSKPQEAADLIIRKQELLDGFRAEWQKALAELPPGQQPAFPLNEKAVANLYMAGHLFGKDFTMEHVAKCLVLGEEVTSAIPHPREGSRYFKLDLPGGAGMPGRFVIPQETGPLGEHVANWNQACEFKFRHGVLSAVIKKRNLPQWLVDYESVFYVIVEENQLPDGKLQVADGPSNNDPEGSWLVSTVHYGQPSMIKPRPPREPKWDSLKGNAEAFQQATSDYQKATARYLKDLDTYSEEQRRAVFVDLEEEGVGQRGVRAQELATEGGFSSEDVSEILNDNIALRKVIEEMSRQLATIQSSVKGLETRAKKGEQRK